MNKVELISDEHAQLMFERRILKLKLKTIEEQLKVTDRKVKDYMNEKGSKMIETKGLKITYTPPREYEALTNQKVAFKYLRENRPDLITKRSGYERLTISLAK